jgi:hypothetical protein
MVNDIMVSMEYMFIYIYIYILYTIIIIFIHFILLYNLSINVCVRTFNRLNDVLTRSSVVVYIAVICDMLMILSFILLFSNTSIMSIIYSYYKLISICIECVCTLIVSCTYDIYIPNNLFFILSSI